MKNSCIIAVLLGAISTSSLASAEFISETGLIQRRLRASPITTDPRITGKEPAPEVVISRMPAGAAGDILWPEKSHIPMIVQTLLACVWILLIGSLPFIAPVLDKRPVTKTQKIVGASMLTVLFGGVYLFTNIILFESVHFKQVRPLTIIECIYFMSQVITTVGYGDIIPSKIRGQVFVGVYVLGAIFIIAMLVSDVTNHVKTAADTYKERLMKSLSPRTMQTSARGRSGSVADLMAPKRPSMKPLLTSLAIFAVIDVCWIIFFSTFPGEKKTVFQAAYMSVITLSTVGLGAFTPLTEEGMIFGAFFMLFGSAALISAIGNFCELVAKMNEYERFMSGSKHIKERAAVHLADIAQGSKQVTKLQFFEWAVINQKLMTATQVKGVFEAFETLDPSGGMVDLKKVEESMDVPLSAR